MKSCFFSLTIASIFAPILFAAVQINYPAPTNLASASRPLVPDGVAIGVLETCPAIRVQVPSFVPRLKHGLTSDRLV
jgi:hypothetical protein